VNHSRLQRERDILVRFQQKTPRVRPLLDEVDPGTSKHALVMKWLNEDLSTRKLAGAQLKFVAKGVLEALQVLHADGYVHTGESELSHEMCQTSSEG
jgi:RIO-like serine/threonine protein kinase